MSSADHRGVHYLGFRKIWAWILPGVAGAVLVASLAVPDSDGAAPQITPTHPPRYSHVAVLVLENHEYRSVIGSPGSPYLSGLAHRSALATGYFGVSHPSLPNYLAMTGGSTFGIGNNCASCTVEGKSIFDQLSEAGITWKAYFEPGSRKVNPFLHYEGSLSDGDAANVVPFGRLQNDIKRDSLPRFSWLGLSLCHDGHSCSVGVSDRYLSHLVPSVVRALGPRGVLFITWDEGTSKAGVAARPGGGHVALIAAGGGARAGARSSAPADHYTLLHTIESAFGLPPLRNAANAPTAALQRLLT